MKLMLARSLFCYRDLVDQRLPHYRVHYAKVVLAVGFFVMVPSLNPYCRKISVSLVSHD